MIVKSATALPRRPAHLHSYTVYSFYFILRINYGVWAMLREANVRRTVQRKVGVDTFHFHVQKRYDEALMINSSNSI